MKTLNNLFDAMGFIGILAVIIVVTVVAIITIVATLSAASEVGTSKIISKPLIGLGLLQLAFMCTIICIISYYDSTIVQMETKEAEDAVNIQFAEAEYNSTKKITFHAGDLHKCSKCGSKAEVQFSKKLGEPYYSEEGFAESFVICTNPECGATTKVYSALEPADAMLQAMLAWNNNIGIGLLPDSFYEEDEEEEIGDGEPIQLGNG